MKGAVRLETVVRVEGLGYGERPDARRKWQ
jgi:hypothetical protein